MLFMTPRVLIVDDHAFVRKAVRLSFESAGFSCCEARDGAEAVAHAVEENPDLILLDLSMPVMNGLQAAPLLKQKLPQVPIILFTMHRSQEVVRLGSAAGISAVMSKDEALSQVVNQAHALLNDSSTSSS